MNKAVLLLHGWLTNCDDFSSLIPFLEKNYQHIEKISYPGHGDNEDYNDFEAMPTIKLVEETFLELQKQFDTVDVIGFSMGGALGTYLASKYHVNKLVLIAPANRYLNFKLPFSKTKVIIQNFHDFFKARLNKNQEASNEVKNRVNAIFEDDKMTVKILKNKYLKKYFHHAYHSFRKVISYVNDNLTEINCPCLLTWGKIDQLVPEESVKEISKLCKIENTQIKFYDDLSHLMILSTDCKLLLQDIENFLKEEEVS